MEVKVGSIDLVFKATRGYHIAKQFSRTQVAKRGRFFIKEIALGSALYFKMT
jgi:hypothetical protein